MTAREMAEILLRHPKERVVCRIGGSSAVMFEVSELAYSSGLTTKGFPLEICFELDPVEKDGNFV